MPNSPYSIDESIFLLVSIVRMEKTASTNIVKMKKRFHCLGEVILSNEGIRFIVSF